MRSPRRARFAAPFVVTVAALTGCASDPPGPIMNPPPPTPDQPTPEQLPQPPVPPNKPPSPQPPHVNPPPPQHPVVALPLPTDPAHVLKDADGSCREFVHVQCPPGVNCNPPPPHPVQCPPGK